MCTRGEKVLACKFSQIYFIFIHVRPRAFSKDAHEVPQIIIFNTLQNDWSSLSFFFQNYSDINHFYSNRTRSQLLNA